MRGFRSLIKGGVMSGMLLLCSLYSCAVATNHTAVPDNKEAENFETEMARLEEELSGCSYGDAGRSCRARVQFERAYISERQSTRDKAVRPRLLLQSAWLYSRVLDEIPDHGPTLKNLALVYASLDYTQGLGGIARSEVNSRESREAARLALLLLGDIDARANKWEQAFQRYREAADLSPGSDVPRRKMVDAYAQLSDENKTQLLMNKLPDWELRFPEVALFAYRTIIRRQKEIAPQTWENALLGWVELTARQRRISPELIDEAFGDLKIPPFQDLKALLNDPAIGTHPPEDDALAGFLNIMDYKGNVGWWTDNPARRHTLAAAALARGHQAIVDGDPELAEKRWIGGLHLAPPMPLYGNELKERSPVPLDLITELLSLQYRYSDLDPSGNKFRLYVELISRSKGQAYPVNDLKAIQRHHIVLGTIFVEKGIWRGSDPANAEFQLTHAIEAAEDRERRTGFHQPLPVLKKYLAQGYKSAKEPNEAKRWYLAAAEGYLDTDQYSRAQEMLEDAGRLDLSGTSLSRHNAMKAVLTTRRRIEEALKKSMAEPKPVTIDLTREDKSWLFEDYPGLSDKFAARQRFKTLADLASLQQKHGSHAQAQKFADKALTVARTFSTLTGTGDLIRLEQALAANSMGLDQTVDLYYDPDLSEIQLAWKEAPDFPARDKPHIPDNIRPDVSVIAVLSELILNFAFDSSQIKPTDKTTLDTLVVPALKAHPRIKIHIAGYADNDGSAEYNLALSQLRAQSVLDYLVSQGISSSRLSVIARGEENPIGINDTAGGRAKNRRVEFIVE